MNRLTRTVVLALAVAALSLVVVPAYGAKKMEVAAQDDAVLLYQQYYNREVALKQLRDLGVSRLRMNLVWHQAMARDQALSRTKPRSINYTWGMWDDAIARAKAYGIKVHLNITGEPPVWACGSKEVPGECDGFKPNNKAFGQFAQAAARHFGKKIDRYSVWNEPNWYTWLSPHKQAPLLYRKLYQAGYKGIKKGNRRAKVLMGETAPYFQKNKAQPPLEFLREMVCVNKKFQKTKNAKKKCKGKLKLDGYAHHPYDFTVKPTKRRKGADNVTMANLPELTNTLDQMRKKGLIKGPKAIPVYLTEHGYFASGTRRIAERKRAKYTVKAFDMAQENARVKQQLYYLLVSPPANHPSAFFDLGLISQDGTVTRTYNKLKSWATKGARTKKVKKPGRCTAC